MAYVDLGAEDYIGSGDAKILDAAAAAKSQATTPTSSSLPKWAIPAALLGGIFLFFILKRK